MKLTPMFQEIKTRYFTQTSIELVRELVLEEYFVLKDDVYELKEDVQDSLTKIDVFLILSQTRYFTESSLSLMYDLVISNLFIIKDGKLIPKKKIISENRKADSFRIIKLTSRNTIEVFLN